MLTGVKKVVTGCGLSDGARWFTLVALETMNMNPELRGIVREELLRSIAWLGLGIVGWPILITEVAWLDATALTVFGLPVLTWAVLTVASVGVRVLTGADASVRSSAGLSVFLVLGVLFGGVGAVYLVVRGYSALAVTAGYVTVTAVAVLWYWYAGVPSAAEEQTA